MTPFLDRFGFIRGLDSTLENIVAYLEQPKNWYGRLLLVLSLMAANFIFRNYFEKSGQYIFDHLDFYVINQRNPGLLSDLEWWQRLLPLSGLAGIWQTTTNVLVHYLNHLFSPNAVFHLINLSAISAAFYVSWNVFRSIIYSVTFAICIAFGTQTIYAYSVAGAVNGHLFFIYVLVALWIAYKIIADAPHPMAWRTAFFPALIVLALAYESWLDILVFGTIAMVGLWVFFERTNRQAQKKNIIFVAVSLYVVAACYLSIKLQHYSAHGPGSESDAVFNYSSPVLMVEDVISNMFIHTYKSVSNFFPPFMVSSNSLRYIGPDTILAEQTGYHQQFARYAIDNHLYLWRFYAGVVFTLLVGWLVHAYRRAIIDTDEQWLPVLLFILLIFTGHTTHTLVKFRPYNTVPLLTYNIMGSITGTAMLISYSLHAAWNRRKKMTGGTAMTLLILLTWCILASNSLTRPGLLNHLSTQVQMGLVPDFWQTLLSRFGL